MGFVRLEIIPRPAVDTPIDSALKTQGQAVARKLRLKMIFKKSAGRVQNSPHIRIFGYTRRDKLFIFVGVGVFHPLSSRTLPRSSDSGVSSILIFKKCSSSETFLRSLVM